MPRQSNVPTPQEDDEMTIDELAQMINVSFIKQDELFAEQLDQNRKEILREIDSRGYITKQDLDETLDRREYITKKDLDERNYVTQHDLQDAIVDAKDEIIAHLDRTIKPTLANHAKRITRLEQRVH